MAYVAEYQRPYEGGYVDLPEESTPEMAAFINARDDALLKIEQFLANLDLSGLGSDYALLSEAGCSLGLDIDSNYVMTIGLKNKAGAVLDSKSIDFPIESSIIDIDYAEGNLIFTLQNGNSVSVGISDIVRGLVSTTRTIAGIDLADDITKEELKEALELGSGGSGDIPTKVSQLENDAGYITQEDIVEAGAVSAGKIKPWLYDNTEEVIIGVYNGKPLYRKSFVILVTCGSGQMVEYNLSDYVNDVEVVINYNAYGDPGDKLPYLYLDGTNQTYSRSVVLFSSIGKIRFSMSSSSSYDNRQVLFIIEYTKTTDAEGSGNGLRPYGIYDAKLDELASSKENIAITTTDQTTMPNSHDGRFLFKKIGGVCEQGENPSSTSPQEIKKSVVSGIKTHGKNFLNVDLTDGTKAGITYQLNADKSITVSGTRTGGSHYHVGFVYLKAGFYTYGVAKGSFENIQCAIIRPGGEIINASLPYVVKVTEENEGLYEFCLKGITNDVVCSGTGYLQVEEGNTITEYEPYTESSITLSKPIDLYGIGDVQDVIEGGKNKRKFVEVVFAGSDDEGWTLSSTLAGRYAISLTNEGVKPFGKCLCTQGIMGVNNTQIVNECYLSQYSAFVINTDFATLEEWKTHLSEKPMTVVYELAAETTEDLPLADQIALNSLATYDEITHLEFDSEVQPTFEGEYGTSKAGGYALEGMLAGRNGELYGKRVEALEATVVNNI